MKKRTRPIVDSRTPKRLKKSCDEHLLSKPSQLLRPKVLTFNDFEGVRTSLKHEGFAVIGNVLNAEERNQFYSGFWDAMEKRVSALDRSDPDTWHAKNVTWKGNYGAGQYKHYGMAQEKHCWVVRKSKRIRDVFERAALLHRGNEHSSHVATEKEETVVRESVPADRELHYRVETVTGGAAATTPSVRQQDMATVAGECTRVSSVVSLDGVAALFEPSTSQLRLHCDLHPCLPGHDFGSVQGAYNFYGVAHDETSGRTGPAFVCVPKSHNGWEERWRKRLSDGKSMAGKARHFVELEPESPLQGQDCIVRPSIPPFLSTMLRVGLWNPPSYCRISNRFSRLQTRW